MTIPPLPHTLLQAIGRIEGYYVDGSRPSRNNNPGDLTYCAETEAFGALHGDPRFAVFPDLETGWDALRRWLSVPARVDPAGNLIHGYLGATLAKALTRFAPPAENDSGNYLSLVCQWTGLSAATILTADLLV